MPIRIISPNLAQTIVVTSMTIISVYIGGMQCNPVDDLGDALRRWPFYSATGKTTNTLDPIGPGPGWAQNHCVLLTANLKF